MIKSNITQQHGYYSSNLTTTFVWAVLLIISLVLSILFALTFINNLKEQNISYKLEAHKLSIAKQVNLSFYTINKKVNEVVTSTLANYDKKNVNAITKKIKQALPESLRVMVSNKRILDIKPGAFPSINYATLDMLKKTKSANQNPIAEIHLFGQQDQYLNYVFIIDNELDTYLIISLPASIILKDLENLTVTTGSIALTQRAGEFSLVKLKTWGTLPKSTNVISNSTNIPNSYFDVEYSFTQPVYLLRGMTTLSSFVGLLSSLLLFTAIIALVLKNLKAQRLINQANQTYKPISKSANQPKTIAQTIAKHENQPLINDMKKTGINKSIFRAYDIRGIVDKTLTVDAVKLIGQAIGSENIKRGKNEIIVARDGRLSGKTLLAALVEGLIKSGCDVINIGAVPTGVLYFATHHLGTGSGVMLTGSHNPPNYNGLKIMLDGETLSGKLIMNLYKAIKNNELTDGKGSEQEMDVVDDYIDYISSDIQLDNELRVVVDAGNGIGGEVGPQLLEEIGCEVIPLHCEIDGNFPNHHPDPSVPKNLEDLILAVKSTDADIGIAFDGDADRLGIVTKEGEIIYPDRLLMLFAQDVLTRQPGASIIFDVKCTGHLPKHIVKHGGLPIIWKTGHSFIKAKIKETNAALAGEMSGHFFFNERWFGFDDGIYAAARLLEILDHEDRPAKEIFDALPNSVSTPELKCETAEGENYAFMEKFKQVAEFPDANITTIDGIRADFADGWGLIRCSNTTPCLVLRFDADNKPALERIKEEFRVQILAVDSSLKLPF